MSGWWVVFKQKLNVCYNVKRLFVKGTQSVNMNLYTMMMGFMVWWNEGQFYGKFVSGG